MKSPLCWRYMILLCFSSFADCRRLLSYQSTQTTVLSWTLWFCFPCFWPCASSPTMCCVSTQRIEDWLGAFAISAAENVTPLCTWGCFVCRKRLFAAQQTWHPFESLNQSGPFIGVEYFTALDGLDLQLISLSTTSSDHQKSPASFEYAGFCAWVRGRSVL